MIGLVFAGGRASRMGGGDKGLLDVGGRTVLERVLVTLEAQCEQIVIIANDDPGRFASFGHPVVADTLPGRPGPLAGLLAGLDYVAGRSPDVGFVVSVPCDAPFLPADLVARLDDRRVADRAAIVQACSGGRRHPVVALWSVALRHDLRRAMTEEGLRRVGAFADRHPLALVTWPTRPVDPFFNVNDAEDLAAARIMAHGFEADEHKAKEGGA